MSDVGFVTGEKLTRDAVKVQLHELLLNINKKLTARGLDFLVLCGEIIKRECPFARSGGAAWVAARALQVPEPRLLGWMRCAESLFKGDRIIVFRFLTPRDVFLDFLVNARLAWVMLKCMDLFDDMLEDLPWTMKDLQDEADKVGSEKFFWFGQPATEEQMKELSERCVKCMKLAITCDHNKRRSRCKECGGSQICEHNSRHSRCKECGGSEICEHNRRRIECKECGGSQICEHNRQRNKCKECGGSDCEDNRERSQCKECGGSQICEHNSRHSRCKKCKESSLGGSDLCRHYRRRDACAALLCVNAQREAMLGKRERGSM